MSAEEIASELITALGQGHIDRISFERLPYKGLTFLEGSRIAITLPRWGYPEQDNYPYRLYMHSNAASAYLFNDDIHNYKHRSWSEAEDPLLDNGFGSTLVGKDWGGAGRTFYPLVATFVYHQYQNDYTYGGLTKKGMMQEWGRGMLLDIYSTITEPDGEFFRKEIAGEEINWLLKDCFTGIDSAPVRSGTYWRLKKTWNMVGTRVPADHTIITVVRNCGELRINQMYYWLFGIAIKE